MVVGTLAGECYNYVYEVFTNPISSAEYIGIIGAAFKLQSFNILTHYPPDLTSSDQREVITRVCTLGVFACGSRTFLERAYYWNPKSPITVFQYVFDFPLDFPG